MTLSFMIKKKYLEEKVREQERTGTFYERRAYNRFWRSRVGSVYRWGPREPQHEAVFLCGKTAWRAEVLGIDIDRTPKEIQEVVKGKICYSIECQFDTDAFEWLHVKFPVKVT